MTPYVLFVVRKQVSTHMKLGLFSYSYRMAFGNSPDYPLDKPVMDIFRFIERVAELKLDGIMWDVMHGANTDDEAFLHKVRTKAQEHNLYIELGWGNWPDLEYTRKGLKVAKLLGANVFRTTTCSDRFDKQFHFDTFLKQSLPTLRDIAELAERDQIRVAIENHADVSAEELATLIQTLDSPYMGVCLDNGNPIATMEDPYAAVERLAPYAFTTHFKDNIIIHTKWGAKIAGTAYGRGIFDLPAMLKVIRQSAPNPNINIECPLEPLATINESLAWEDEAISQSVRYARDILAIR